MASDTKDPMYKNDAYEARLEAQRDEIARLRDGLAAALTPESPEPKPVAVDAEEAVERVVNWYGDRMYGKQSYLTQRQVLAAKGFAEDLLTECNLVALTTKGDDSDETSA